MKMTKFSKSVYESLDVTKLYDIEEAFSMIMNFKRDSFNESVDVAFNLGVDPRHADENIRLSKENVSNQKKIQELEDKFKALKIANTISLNENTVNETKIEINKLINEIDMCISQISD